MRMPIPSNCGGVRRNETVSTGYGLAPTPARAGAGFSTTEQGQRHSTMAITRLPALLGTGIAAALSVQSVAAVQDEDFGFDTTEDLYQVCSVEADAAEHIPAAFACRGFIEGTVQYHDAVTERKNLKRLICYPSSATVKDGRWAFVAWAKKHANDKKLMQELPVVGLVRALAEKYPCKK